MAVRSKLYLKWAVLLAALALGAMPGRAVEVLSLKGEWEFALDEKNEGVTNECFTTPLPDTIVLPGTTDEQKKGLENTATNLTSRLTRLHPYAGPAWYQMDVDIPSNWYGKRITLFLERTKPTTVWVDDKPVGSQDSLVAPHIYDLTAALLPGLHRLTICVNNGRRLPVNGGHQLSDDTQTNWNGILGRLELRATDKVWIDDIQVFSDIKARKVKVLVTLGNQTGRPASGTIDIATKSLTHTKHHVPAISVKFDQAGDGAVVTAEYQLGADAVLWDEFTPALHRLAVTLCGEAGDESFGDRRERDFGLREFTTKGTQFCINWRTIFLRGKHDACVFPLTGYAPMEADGWLRVFRIAKAYGINHYRFHSWCPPEAAFVAADQIGIYLQPELANFGGDLSKNPAAADYTRAEGRRILKTFGNHPSFVMFALGNEMHGGREVRADIVKEFRRLDSRHLYAQASNYDLGNPQFATGDDYWTTFRTRKGATGAVRGSFAHIDAPLGHVQIVPPSTTNDYAKALTGVPVPVIGHEVGQYQLFPNFKEIKKYTGVLRARNFEVFQERLTEKGLLDLDDEFADASGKLAAICYREEIEAALRTPGFGGFQLLDLQDFPGQGTALVGILDAFMDSKGAIEPRAWREFCEDTVPLVLMAKRVWSTNETFTATVKVANYGPAAISNAVVTWRLTAIEGREIGVGRLPAKDIPQGALVDVGRFNVRLNRVTHPRKMSLAVRIGGTGFQNRYDFWVYPATADAAPPANVTVSRVLDDNTRKVLADGGAVVLLPEPKTLANSIEGFFAPDFWCFPMFRRLKESPGTLGLYCDPTHPALAQFPTETHSDWQWWQIVMHSRAVILDDTPATFRPIVQVIDNFDHDRNHKLGLIFEAKVGPGRLLVCASDLPALQDQPEARQLFASLLAYAGSPEFNPPTELAIDAVQKILFGR